MSWVLLTRRQQQRELPAPLDPRRLDPRQAQPAARRSFLGDRPELPDAGEDSFGFLLLNHPPLVPAYPYVRGPQLERVRYVPPTRASTEPFTWADASQTALRVTWDRGGSLLATLELGFPVRPNLVADLYPGLVRAGPVQLGGYVYADKDIRALALTVSEMPAMWF